MEIPLDTQEPIKKKRGRKPKHQHLLNNNINNNDSKNINTEEENIVLHLPITINEINTEIFLKNDSDVPVTNNIHDTTANSSDILTTINQNNFINNNVNKIITHTINITPTTKCWWCKYTFTTHAVQLPENYFNELFYCIGHFCSFNCAKSYNISINDSLIQKRETLLNLFYYYTFSEFKEIIQAPNWITLIDYGGPLSIEEFRENSIFNLSEFTILTPPLISRQIHIEESYKSKKQPKTLTQSTDNKKKNNIKNIIESSLENIIR